ncbi:MAG: lytic murein transglycosylase [Deltaproteobacteria bacterium]|nr:lytic murein transglycosylase [Deltaproteobacteria bacterium]
MKFYGKYAPCPKINRILFFVCISILLTCGYAAGLKTADRFFAPLKQRLLSEKKPAFNAKLINNLFSSPRLTANIKGISRYFKHNEAKLNYDQFLSADSIGKAKAYMKNHKQELLKAKKEYGVDPAVITAIMLVETRLGAYTGKQSVFGILATMAALADKDARDFFWSRIHKQTNLTRSRFDKKAKAKAQWAYRELTAYIQYTSRDGFDPLALKGSYAGALGLAQFMPTNILTLGRDGNKDGRVDLFNHDDAIASIAEYLKHYGWKPGINRKTARKAVYNYNHSSYYVDIILKVADRLKAGS